MDDFRVGSVPSSEPYGDRHPYGSIARKRQKHHDGGSGEQNEPGEPADSVEVSSGEEEPSPAAEGEAQDYYLPSEPAVEDE